MYVYVLGGFRLVGPDGAEVRLPMKGLATLIALLSLSRRGRTRTELCSMIWPEAEEQAARTNLRTHLYRLRQVVDADLIVDDGHRLRLNLDAVVSELPEIEDLHRQVMLSESSGDAIVLMRREFEALKRPLLPEIEASWLPSRRERCQLRFLEIGLMLARALEQEGDTTGARETLISLAELRPTSEACEHLLRLEAREAGNEAALTLLKRFRVVEADLSPRCSALIRALRADAYQPVPAPDSVSNTREMRLLANLFESNIAHGEDHAWQLLATEYRRRPIWSYPLTAVKLLAGLLEAHGSPSVARAQAASAGIGLASFVGDFALAEDWIEFSLRDLPPDSPDYATTVGYQAIVHFEQNQTEEGLDRNAVAIDLCRTLGLEAREHMFLCNRAGGLLMLNRIQEANEIVAKIEQFVVSQPEDVQQRFRSFLSVIELQRRLTVGDAGQILEQALLAESLVEPLNPIGYCRLPHLTGLAMVRVGDAHRGLRHLAKGVRFAVQMEAKPALIDSLESAGAALIESGESESGYALLRQATHHRRVAELRASPLQVASISHHLEHYKNLPSPALEPLTSLAYRALDALSTRNA
jgi:DNA-binding SARP family transcriptional activator